MGAKDFGFVVEGWPGMSSETVDPFGVTLASFSLTSNAKRRGFFRRR